MRELWTLDLPLGVGAGSDATPPHAVDAQLPASACQPTQVAPANNNEPVDEHEFQRLYGPWRPMQPGEVASLMGGCGFRWWLAGGWALEAAGAAPRSHGDTDLAVLRKDLPLVREWLFEFHLWEAHSGTLRPLVPGDTMTEGREQLWVRRDAYGPWLLDVVSSPSEGDDWLYKRHDDIRLPLDDVGWISDGVPYFRPEVVLLFKAKAGRPKDDLDFDSMSPRLEPPAREWLLDALRLTEPESPWIVRLEALD
jgi:hypothetical protein